MRNTFVSVALIATLGLLGGCKQTTPETSPTTSITTTNTTGGAGTTPTGTPSSSGATSRNPTTSRLSDPAQSLTAPATTSGSRTSTVTAKPGPKPGPPKTATSKKPDGDASAREPQQPKGKKYPVCDINTLPPETARIAALIRAGGPFKFARKDGSTFGNREGRLPKERRGYYREYTVLTPGVKHRGARRIVTGGNPATDPPFWYYTKDHYESFCLIAGA